MAVLRLSLAAGQKGGTLVAAASLCRAPALTLGRGRLSACGPLALERGLSP